MILKEEKTLLINLVADKVDLCEKKIKKLNKDYKYYTEDRAKWIPGEVLGDPNSNYAKEIKRQIDLENDKINRYNILIDKIKELS